MNSKLSCGFCRKADIFGRKAAHLVKECPLLAKTECSIVTSLDTKIIVKSLKRRMLEKCN